MAAEREGMAIEGLLEELLESSGERKTADGNVTAIDAWSSL